MLSQERDTPHKSGELKTAPVAAGVKILAGALVALSATGYLTPGDAATTLKDAGRAEETVDNTDGLAGDVSATYRKGVFRYDNSAAGDAITRADIGNDCYIVDDETVAKTDGTGTRSVAGKVHDVDAAGIWVKFS